MAYSGHTRSRQWEGRGSFLGLSPRAGVQDTHLHSPCNTVKRGTGRRIDTTQGVQGSKFGRAPTTGGRGVDNPGEHDMMTNCLVGQTVADLSSGINERKVKECVLHGRDMR
jgi:hypothetical protein